MPGKRIVSIELFRCLCMFGVCLLHALDKGGYAGAHRGLDNLVTPSVVGFLFITGWFGLRLKVRNALHLVFVGLYCALAVTVVYNIGIRREGDITGLFLSFWHCFAVRPWFLWCYFALMLIAPVFDPLFEDKGRSSSVVLRRVIPVVLLVFGWSYAATKVLCVNRLLPNVGGFGDFGLLTFIGIYLVARTCSHLRIDQHLKTWALLLAAILSGAICWIGFKHYHSPFALLLAGSLFMLFKRLPMNSPILSRSVMLLSPSMLSVYLIHDTPMGLAFLRYVEDGLIGGDGYNYYLVCLLVACCFFFGALVLDAPRRLWIAWREQGEKPLFSIGRSR